MKLVVAIIKPFKLDEVRQALTAIGVHGMTVTEVKGYGRQKGHTEIYRGAEYVVNFLPKLRIEIAVSSDIADKAVEVITSSARTGQIGDGNIFVTPIDHALRIRTGETDSDALEETSIAPRQRRRGQRHNNLSGWGITNGGTSVSRSQVGCTIFAGCLFVCTACFRRKF